MPWWHRNTESVCAKKTTRLDTGGLGNKAHNKKRARRSFMHSRCGTRPQPFQVATDSSISNRFLSRASFLLSFSPRLRTRLVCSRHPAWLLYTVVHHLPRARVHRTFATAPTNPPFRITDNTTSGNYFGIYQFLRITRIESDYRVDL